LWVAGGRWRRLLGVSDVGLRQYGRMHGVTWGGEGFQRFSFRRLRDCVMEERRMPFGSVGVPGVERKRGASIGGGGGGVGASMLTCAVGMEESTVRSGCCGGCGLAWCWKTGA